MVFSLQSTLRAWVVLVITHGAYTHWHRPPPGGWGGGYYTQASGIGSWRHTVPKAEAFPLVNPQTHNHRLSLKLTLSLTDTLLDTVITPSVYWFAVAHGGDAMCKLAACHCYEALACWSGGMLSYQIITQQPNTYTSLATYSRGSLLYAEEVLFYHNVYWGLWISSEGCFFNTFSFFSAFFLKIKIEAADADFNSIFFF